MTSTAMTRLTTMATALVLATSGLVGITAAAADAAAGGDHLDRGQRLTAGQSISRFVGVGSTATLRMQSDGNLVLYGSRHGRPTQACWATNTVNRGLYAIYQNDGNFVVYDSRGRATWASNTVGSPSETGTTVNINDYGTVYAGFNPLNTFCVA